MRRTKPVKNLLNSGKKCNKKQKKILYYGFLLVIILSLKNPLPALASYYFEERTDYSYIRVNSISSKYSMKVLEGALIIEGLNKPNYTRRVLCVLQVFSLAIAVIAAVVSETYCRGSKKYSRARYISATGWGAFCFFLYLEGKTKVDWLENINRKYKIIKDTILYIKRRFY